MESSLILCRIRLEEVVEVNLRKALNNLPNEDLRPKLVAALSHLTSAVQALSFEQSGKT